MSVLLSDGRPVDWANPPKATDMVMWSYAATNGKAVRGSLRTIAHLDWVSSKAERRFGQRILVLQPPFNTTVPASAGTHDFDNCLDWYIPGVSWWTQQRFWRANGGWGWYRHPPLFGHHMHGGCIPVPNGGSRADDFATRVGIFVPGQLIDHFNRAFGLSGQHTPGSDRSWFPKDMDAVIFDLDAFIRDQQEALDMQMSDKLFPDSSDPKLKDVTVGDALRRDFKTNVRRDEQMKKLLEVPSALKDIRSELDRLDRTDSQAPRLKRIEDLLESVEAAVVVEEGELGSS